MTESQDKSQTGGRPLIEIVPNFSEGRRRDVIDAIVVSAQVPGALLLNTQWDPDHNRLDCTLIGDADAVRRSALACAAKAIELIDMTTHTGSHPRMGAVDVIPFVPVRGVSMDQCVQLARDVAREIAETLNLPVYCYDQAALSPERRSLADVRKGEYEGLKADVAAGRRLPDFGPHEIGRAGAVAVGARKPLIAFNAYFRGSDEGAVAAVKDVARRVRESSGGLRNVRAIGFDVPERGMVTVSLNLVDHEQTPIYRALELVRTEASRHGLAVAGTEIVGLVPQAAVSESAAHYLQLDGFDPDEQILENLVARADVRATPAAEATPPAAGSAHAGDGGSAASARQMRMGAFMDRLASSDPTPGGGTAAAVAGATGSALVEMVGRLTAGKDGFAAVQDRMRAIMAEANEARTTFLALADRDAEAFDSVMASFKLPKSTDEEKAARSRAIQRAYAGAAAVPLDVARLAVRILDLAREVTQIGNPNAASDGAAGAQLLFAACQAALRNVEINVASLKDEAERTRMTAEAEDLGSRSAQIAEDATRAFRDRMS
jgi:glutamate formiminotransferase/formiminotetrahydrofolate cyclodeaminase